MSRENPFPNPQLAQGIAEFRGSAEEIRLTIWSGPPPVRIYCLTKSGVIGKMINQNALGQVLLDPFHSPVCQDCGSDRCTGWLDESCKGRMNRAFRKCPVCAKKFYDPKPTGKFRDDEGVPEWPETAAERVDAMVAEHFYYYHRNEAKLAGLRED